jgi:hypothetical protein
MPAADRKNAQFAIDGTIRCDGTCIKMTVQLVEIQTGRLIWSESYRSVMEAAGTIALQEKIARATAVKIAGKQGWIAKYISKRSKRRPLQHSGIYEAILQYYGYEWAMTPTSFSRAWTALKNAVVSDPECGPAWSMMARLLADMYVFDMKNSKDSLDRAFEYAQNGLHLSPDDQRCKTIMALIHMFRNDLKSGLAEKPSWPSSICFAMI